MSATIKDIAKKLGVSAAAVSKALNNCEDVSTALKEQVRQAARELNYFPNTIAKSLVNNKSNTLGVFLLSREAEVKRETGASIATDFIGGILAEANKRGYDILLFATDGEMVAKKSYIELCRERRVEGAVFTGLKLDDPYLEELKLSSFPISIIDTRLQGEKINYVATDNRLGVQMALNYLWNLGHRSIAIINGHRNAQISKVRFSAYREFLKEKGIYDRRLVFTGDFSRKSGYGCGLQIANLVDRPTAVFAASDLMAYGLIQDLKEKMIDVPHHISVIGFDNLLIGKYTQPELTTVGQDAFSMGRKAVSLVIDQLQHKDMKKKSEILKPELIIRNSCAPVF